MMGALRCKRRRLFETLEDRVGVLLDVVERPEVEGKLHRLSVPLAKQRPYVLLEADRLVGGGQDNPLLFVGWP